MRLRENLHLTYCSNIHPGETWEEVRRNIATHLPEVRRHLQADGALGIGLRLSASAATALEKPHALDGLRDLLLDLNAYVLTINGFPYGAFHRTRVKESVYLPDWRDEARLAYADQLAHIFAALLPDEKGFEGSISTVPGAFRNALGAADDVRRMAQLMLRHAAELHKLRESAGKTITLALEPEPCCYLETVDDAIVFFRDFLHHRDMVQGLAVDLGLSFEEADRAITRHIGICYDACHMAVQFEDPEQAMARLRAAGIKICKVQVSSALKLRFRDGDDRPRELLAPFAESPYLHQIVELSDSGLSRFVDLPDGLAAVDRARTKRSRPSSREWRIHFHVPIFLSEMAPFETTQDHLILLLEHLGENPVCPCLEVETYTWDVLPARYRMIDTDEAIARELTWARSQLQR
jgi:sugar phosphate isomerase/epimerase